MNIYDSTGNDSNLNIFNIENTPNTGENDDLELQFNTVSNDLTLYNKISPQDSSTVNLNSLDSDGSYLKLNGSSEMTGNINLNNNKIINSSNPTSSNDLVNLSYVSNELNNYLLKSGGIMTGTLNMNNNKIVGLPIPTADNEASNKKYVDDAISGGTSGTFLPITGGNITGNLNVEGNLIASGEYLRIGSSSLGMTIKDEFKDGGNNEISFKSNRPTTSFYFGSNEILSLNSTESIFSSKLKINDEIDLNNNKIINVSTPTENTDAANKDYVDSKIITGNEEFFKTYQLNYKQFCNYGLWDQVDLHAYVKVLSIYMIRDPLINNEMVNLYPYNNSGSYKSIQTPKNNPSAFQFYGKCYSQSGNIKKGKFETVLNIPLCTTSDSALSASYLYNQYPKINCQAILGKSPTIDSTNITVECYCAQTKIVTMIGGRNTYGNNVANNYNTSTDKQPIFQMQFKYSFFVPYDLSTNELYIYLNFSASDNSFIAGKYFNCLFGDVFSDMTKETFYINGYTTYTNQLSTTLTSDEQPIMTGTEQQGNLINSYFKYNLVNNQSVYNHDYTYLSIDEIEKLELENDYIHSVTKKNTTATNNLIQLNINPFNTNHNVFYDDDMMIDNIINITLHIKQLSTNGSIQLLFRLKDNEDVTSTESQTLNLINSDNWETYNLNLSDYKNQNLKLTSLDLVINNNTLLSFDWFNFHYVSGNDIKNKFIYWTIWNNNNVLQYTKPDEVEDLSHRVKLLEDYINLFKQTYTIVEE